jgi:RNA binding exosome subunit
MNERIRELAEQAGIGFWGNRIIIFDFSADSEEVIQKFAELIVEECRYVMDCNKGSDQNPAWNRALSETSEKIKEHFGVE